MAGFFTWTTIRIYRQARISDANKADAIIVLGARQEQGRPLPVFQARLDQALELYRANMASLIIITGGIGEGKDVSEAQAGWYYLVQKGAPPDAILLENKSRTTWQNLNNVTMLAEGRGINKVILVSDGFHLFRARQMAEDLGLVSYTAPAKLSPIASNQIIEFKYIVRENIVYLLYLLFNI